MTSAVILGCSALRLSKAERSFFREFQPWGFILFGRNLDAPDQIRALTEELRATVDRPDAPILIDQEGGRVQRLGPPHWPVYPTGRAYGAAAGNDPLLRREITRLGARLMALDLHRLGINVDCVPVLDVPSPGAHDIIGDRAYADEPDGVSVLGRAAAEGLIAGGVLPVIKHVPGHGRAGADSHEELPRVDASYEALDGRDFEPFRVLSDMPMAMTAHVLYEAVDPKRPATSSKRVIRGVIREAIGFDGLLMCDDLSMKALSGSLTKRAKQAAAAGCDMLMLCHGDMADQQAVLAGTPKLAGKAKRRADAALRRIARTPEPFDEAEARVRFAAAFEGSAI